MGRGAEWLAAILVVGHAGSVAADTIVPLGNLGNQTWTPTGNPYVISGDVLVQPGATLTIDAGTVVTFAAGDTQAGGENNNQSELQVSGTLAIDRHGGDAGHLPKRRPAPKRRPGTASS